LSLKRAAFLVSHICQQMCIGSIGSEMEWWIQNWKQECTELPLQCAWIFRENVIAIQSARVKEQRTKTCSDV
jgi:hypothetical protein